MNAHPHARRRWLQFSLRGLLLLIASVAGMLWAYHAGYRKGVDDGKTTGAPQGLVYRVYPVSDLITGQNTGGPAAVAGSAQLISLIQTKVHPETWTAGAANIQYFAPNSCLVVANRPAVHQDVQEFLQRVRRGETFDHTVRNSVIVTAVTVIVAAIAMLYLLKRRRAAAIQ